MKSINMKAAHKKAKEMITRHPDAAYKDALAIAMREEWQLAKATSWLKCLGKGKAAEKEVKETIKLVLIRAYKYDVQYSYELACNAWEMWEKHGKVSKFALAVFSKATTKQLGWNITWKW